MEDKKNTIIGKHAIVTDAPNKSLIGLDGIIINETKNTLVFDVDGKRKTVLKTSVQLSVNGEQLSFENKRVEERIKSR